MLLDLFTQVVDQRRRYIGGRKQRKALRQRQSPTGRFLDLGPRLVGSSHAEQRQPQVAPGLDIVRVDIQGVAQPLLGLLRPAVLLGQHAQVIVKVGKLVRDLERLPEFDLGGRTVAGTQTSQAQLGVGFGRVEAGQLVIGVGVVTNFGDRLLEFANGIVILVAIEVNDATRVMLVRS